MRKVIARGRRNNGLYTLKADRGVGLQSCYVSKGVLEIVWHHRLGHLNKRTLRNLHKNGDIDVFGWYDKNVICRSCAMGKMTKLPLMHSISTSPNCFDKIHYDIWRSAPTVYANQFIYYACLVDDKSK